MGQSHVIKRNKIRSIKVLEQELPKLKNLVSESIFNCITSLIEEASHNIETAKEITGASADDYVSPNQAAVILQASRPYIRKLIDKKTLRAHKIGSHYRIQLSDVLTLKESWAPKQEENFSKMNANLDKLLNDSGWDD